VVISEYTVLTLLLTLFLCRCLPVPTKTILCTVLVTVCEAPNERLSESSVTGTEGNGEKSSSSPRCGGTNRRPETVNLLPANMPLMTTEAMSPGSSGSPRKSVTGTVAGEPNSEIPTDPVPTWLAVGQLLPLDWVAVQSADTDRALEANPRWSSTSSELGRVEKPVTPAIDTDAVAADETVSGVSVADTVLAAALPTQPSVIRTVIVNSLRTASHATRPRQRPRRASRSATSVPGPGRPVFEGGHRSGGVAWVRALPPSRQGVG